MSGLIPRKQKSIKKLYTLVLLLGILSVMGMSFYANATENADLMPTISTKAAEEYNESDNTHPPIRLTPDKSEIINLSANAASIIIGNPNHLGILADAANRLVLVPRMPGASAFTILDHSGNIIMQRHAIIASPKQQYVRIRRSCVNGGENCQETSVFYCPDMCHEIMIDTSEIDSGVGASVASAGQSTVQTELSDESDIEDGAE